MAGAKTKKKLTRGSNSSRRRGTYDENRTTDQPDSDSDSSRRRRGRYDKKRTTDKSDSDSDAESRQEESFSSGSQSKRARTGKPFDLITEHSKTVSSYSTDSKQLHEKMMSTISVIQPQDSKHPTVGKRVAETMKNDIKTYMRNTWYKWVKFYINEKKAATHLKAGITSGSLTIPATLGLTTDAYVKKYSPVIKSKLGDLRRNSFQNVKARYEKLKKRNKVPVEFPGDVLVPWNTDKEEAVLPENYRRWDEPPMEFLYFVENVMQALRPNENKFHDQKAHSCISEIFTVSDEAFALVILLNEYHCWDKNGHVPKRFVNATSGNKQGWSVKGLNAYTSLCNEVAKRRLEEGSNELERIMMSGYGAGKSNGTGQQSATANADELLNADYEDEDENQVLDVIFRQQELETNNDMNGHNNALLELT